MEVYTRPPAKGDKLTKKEAGYEPSGPFGCRHCFWFTGGDWCEILDEKVSPGACCDYWNDKNAPRGGATKEEAEFVHVPGSGYRCDECKFWQGHNHCTPVLGWISPGGSCNKWMPQEGAKHWLTNASKTSKKGS